MDTRATRRLGILGLGTAEVSTTSASRSGDRRSRSESDPTSPSTISTRASEKSEPRPERPAELVRGLGRAHEAARGRERRGVGGQELHHQRTRPAARAGHRHPERERGPVAGASPSDDAAAREEARRRGGETTTDARRETRRAPRDEGARRDGDGARAGAGIIGERPGSGARGDVRRDEAPAGQQPIVRRVDRGGRDARRHFARGRRPGFVDNLERVLMTWT